MTVSLFTANGKTFTWLGRPPKMAVVAQVGDVKTESPVSYLVHCHSNKVNIF